MSDMNRGESLSIRDSGKSLKKYGSTCNHIKRPEYFVTHIVLKTDTLQGLALRYNTTTEEIRRVNRLFACDSLFLRGSLKIPVTKDVAASHGVDNGSSNHSSSGSTSETATTSSLSTESFSDDDQKCVNDFLSKIDSAIASTRAQVRHVQQNSHFVDGSDPTMVKRRTHRRHNPASLEADPTDAPHAVVLNQGRKVRNSLQRLEREGDAMFEL